MKVFLKIFLSVSLLLSGISYSSGKTESNRFSTDISSSFCQNLDQSNHKVLHQGFASSEELKLVEDIVNITLKFSAIDLVFKSTRFYFKIHHFSKIREKLLKDSVFVSYPYLYIFFRVFRL